jgi:nitrite reductase/ring-hydroxylating ferredoxin subunit
MKSSPALYLPEPTALRSLPIAPSSERLPASWYAVMPSSALARGKVKTFKIGSTEGVLFRDLVHQKTHALDAHCMHLGAHLKHGRVVGESIECPLHHFRYGPDGSCVHPPKLARDACPKARTYPTAEAHGLVYVYLGRTPRYPLPALSLLESEPFTWVTGESVQIDCGWQAVAANSFDLDHFQTVHRRALVGEPSVEMLDRQRMRIRYVSRVSGDTLSDRAMRALSSDDIRVCITCHGGTVLVVETITKRTRSAAVLGARPEGNGTRVEASFAVSTPPLLRPLALLATRWLFTSFMQKDVTILGGARLNMESPFVRDPSLTALFAFLKQLPTEEP